MGMIAFYAGLVIGILLGFLLTSLFAFSLAISRVGKLPDRGQGISGLDTLES
jgi:type III secretory pathway component EscT